MQFGHFSQINKRLENDLHAGRRASEAHKSHRRKKAAILWLLCPVSDGEPWKRVGYENVKLFGKTV